MRKTYQLENSCIETALAPQFVFDAMYCRIAIAHVPHGRSSLVGPCGYLIDLIGTLLWLFEEKANSPSNLVMLCDK